MRVIAVTGGIGAGKSTVSRLLKERGFTIIDADKIAHQILEKPQKAYDELLRLFGHSILDAEQNINRGKLAKMVFSDPVQLGKLNKITHRYIFEEMQKQRNECEKKNQDVCMEVPLLFQCDFPLSYDLSIAVIASHDLRIQRIVARDHCTEEAAEKRIRSQLSNEELMAYADYIIYNETDEADLHGQLDTILSQQLEKEGGHGKETI